MQTTDLVSQFLGECGVRGLSPATVEQYNWAFPRLLAHCPEMPDSGQKLLPVLQGSLKLAPESRRDLLKCLRTFFRWAERRHHLPNPCGEVDPLPRPRRLPRVLAQSEIDSLLAAAQTARDNALVLLVLDCGIRLSELASLRREDVRDGWLLVRGKVGVRQVPVSKGMLLRLLRLARGEDIWLGQRGPLNRAGVQGAYKRLFARASITRKVGSHSLRHTFATLYLRSGGGVRQLQEILGHSRIETTMIYVHLAGNDVAADHALHSPVQTMGLMS